mmetsp:Transcript_8110/g.36466  ORF Transcript_8110/g.36466 Transcript_8110/m.36466 type:complete len:220 (-) Transcript_8110:1443-2102(-)
MREMRRATGSWSGSTVTRSRTSPPSRVNLMLLLMTLMRACRRRNLSPRTLSPSSSGATSNTSSTWFLFAWWPTMSTSSLTISLMSNDSMTSSWCMPLPLSSFAKSRIWPMIPRSASAETMAEETNSRWGSVRVSSSKSNELNAMMELSGVRSSCEMFATNALCNADTDSASRLAFSSVVAASCEYRLSSSASVNKPSSKRINPSALFMSQKLEKMRLIE